MFVEADAHTKAVIERNLTKTKLKGSVRNQDVFVFLQRGAGKGTFEIIFADPPYEKTKRGGDYTETLLNNEALPRLLESGGMFVLEKRPEEALPEMNRWRIIRRKAYGATEVLFLSKSEITDRQLVCRSLGAGGSAIR